MLCLAGALSSVGHAQLSVISGNRTMVGVSPVVADPVGDQEWSRVSGLTKTPAAAVAVQGTAQQRAAAIAQRASATLSAAREAKAFYQRFPNHPKVPAARKLEAASLIESLKLGNKSLESEAFAVAEGIRKDGTLFRTDRFDVALSVERYRMKQQIGAKNVREAAGSYEALADSLQREFGPVPEVFGLYLNIARSSSADVANRLATKVLEMRPSGATRQEAEAITTRYALIGNPVTLQLTSISGEKVTISPATANGTPTVLYVWAPEMGTKTSQAGAKNAQPDAKAVQAEAKKPFIPLNKIRNDLAKQPTVRWVYLAQRSERETALKSQMVVPKQGTFCLESGDGVGLARQLLRGMSGPSVFVFDSRGVLKGYGQPDELPALLASLNR